MTTSAQQEFGKIRSFFWPVHSYELKKLLPMFLMFFFISFNYTILRDTKDSIIVPNVGAEAIPFLKVYGVVPGAIIFMIIYAKLSNILSKPALFYASITPFIVFFALFATVLYPFKDQLMLHTSADWLATVLPQGAAGLVESYRNWVFSVFYIMSELWGSAVLSLMFWGFANDIMKTTEAKRFYTLLGFGANLALVCSGPLIYYFSLIQKGLPAGQDPWQISLNYLVGMFTLAALSVVAIYWWMNKNVLTDPRFYSQTDEKKMKKEKPKMSLMESFAFLAKSKYILCITILVLSYGVCINLVEVTFKGQVKLQYPTSNEYSAFMGLFSTVTGIVTMCMMFIGGWLIRKKGWGFSAMVTPAVLMITGVLFLSFVIFRESLTGYIAMIGTTPLFLAVLFGAAQNIMSKSTKYSLFDPTKEMSYIPLDPESKVKGKAAIDVVGARLGKSGGSLIQQGLLVMTGSLAAITPYVAVLMVLMIGVWMIAVKVLNKQYVALTGENVGSKQTAVKAQAETAAV